MDYKITFYLDLLNCLDTTNYRTQPEVLSCMRKVDIKYPISNVPIGLQTLLENNYVEETEITDSKKRTCFGFRLTDEGLYRKREYEGELITVPKILHTLCRNSN